MKDTPFVCKSEQQLPFETMISAFSTAPALCHTDHEREVLITTYTLDYVWAGVLSPGDDKEVLQDVAYFSKKHTAAECHHDMYVYKLILIFNPLEEWRLDCEGAAYPIQQITDYNNIYKIVTQMVSIGRGAQ
jgi:hypothetical protein